jgi:ABC-type uncharacterized transport system permease subunit
MIETRQQQLQQIQIQGKPQPPISMTIVIAAAPELQLNAREPQLNALEPQLNHNDSTSIRHPPAIIRMPMDRTGVMLTTEGIHNRTRLLIITVHDRARNIPRQNTETLNHQEMSRIITG